MNLNPKQPSITDPEPTSARRSSLITKLSERLGSGKAKEAKLSSSDAASVTSHTPLVTSDGGGSESASTEFERKTYAELMDKTNGMTPEQVKEYLAQHEKEHEEKFHEVANVGRWQWKFTDVPEKSKKFRGE